jgi:predicted Zn-dependent protease
LIDYSKDPAKSNNTICIKKRKDNAYYITAMQVTELTSETRDDATLSISATLALKPNRFPKECSHD